MTVLLTALFGLIVGLSLGLTGGGGSIFAIPLLVYGLGLTMTEAVPISLFAVAVTAAVGGWYSWRAGLLLWQPIVMFSAGGIVGAPAGIYLSEFVGQDLLVMGFTLLALVVGALMLRHSITRPEQTRVIRALTDGEDAGPVCRLSADGKLHFTTPCALILMLAGLATGLLSGLFGVGGGFLIVPALMLVIELGIHRAVAASLAIITLIGLAGSISALVKGELQAAILLPFIGGSVLGMLAGRRIADRIAGPVLQRLFASTILVTGTAMLIATLFT